MEEKKEYLLQVYNPDTGDVQDRIWDERYDLPIESYRGNKNVTVIKL